MASHPSERSMSEMWIFAALAGLLIISVIWQGDYGLSWDEPTEMGSVKFTVEHITRGKALPADTKYYGIVFNAFSEAVYQAIQWIDHGAPYNPVATIAEAPVETNAQVAAYLRERMPVKHALTFLAALTCMAAAALMAKNLLGPPAGILTVLCLTLMPRFWGHAFFNPKDIPFAAAFTMGSFLGWRLITRLQSEEARPIGWKTTLLVVGMGAFIGLATGVRIGGFFLLGFIPLAHMGARYDRGAWPAWFKKHMPLYLLMAVAWFAVTIAVHPVAWSSPLTWFIETLTYMSGHQWNDRVLFGGHLIHASSLPRTYLPLWLAITVPVGWQLFALVGGGWLVFKVRELSAEKRSMLLLVLLQLTVLPLVAIIKSATVYDGMRHFLFVLPALAILSVAGFIFLMRIVKSQPLKIALALATMIYAGSVVMAMVRLHPYQYTYFNAAVGGLKNAGRYFEKDYWGLSLKESMEWINANAPEGSDVFVGGLAYSAQIYARPDLRISQRQRAGNKWVFAPMFGAHSSPFYYLGVNRWGFARDFSTCEQVYGVVRDQTLLSVVRQCE